MVIWAMMGREQTFADGENALLDLGDVGEGLEDEEIDAGVAECQRLLAEELKRFLGRRRAVRLDADADGPMAPAT